MPALTMTLCLLAATAAGCATTPASSSRAATATARSCPHLVVPAYFTPQSGPGWQLMAKDGTALRWVIMNPDNGPGGSREAQYAHAVAVAAKAGVHILGYVPTGEGRRSSASVLAEVARYRKWYGVTGIFFDEVPTSASLLARYRAYAHAVHKARGTVVLNPGTVPDRAYFGFADAVVTFEGTAAQYEHRNGRPTSLATVPDRKIWNVVTAAPAASLNRIIGLASSTGAGVIYVTDATQPNPYDRLPSYWSTEVKKIAQIVAAPCR